MKTLRPNILPPVMPVLFALHLVLLVVFRHLQLHLQCDGSDLGEDYSEQSVEHLGGVRGGRVISQERMTKEKEISRNKTPVHQKNHIITDSRVMRLSLNLKLPLRGKNNMQSPKKIH